MLLLLWNVSRLRRNVIIYIYISIYIYIYIFDF
jgi:hypothetical protein